MASDCGQIKSSSGQIFCTVFAWAAVIGMIVLMLVGANSIASANEYTKSSTQETCYILDSDQGKGCGRAGLNNKYFEYAALAIDKCGNDTILYSEYDACIAVEDAYEVGSEQSCQVLDCDEERFSLESLSYIKGNGQTELWCGIIFGCIALITAIVFSYGSWNKFKQQK